jgi:hypothetical protein
VSATFSFYSNVFHSTAGPFMQAGTNYTADSLPDNILIINSFDAMSIKARDKKKELFLELVDSLKSILQKRTERRKN